MIENHDFCVARPGLLSQHVGDFGVVPLSDDLVVSKVLVGQLAGGFRPGESIDVESRLLFGLDVTQVMYCKEGYQRERAAAVCIVVQH